jgi:RHS repeat-associated protein
MKNMNCFSVLAFTLLIAVKLFGQLPPEPPCSASLAWEPAPTGILIHLSGTVPGSEYAPNGVHLVLFAKFPNQQPVAVGGLTCDSPATTCTSDELFDGCVIAPHYSMAVAPCNTTQGTEFIDPVVDRQPMIAKFDAGSLLAKIDVSFPNQGHSGILPRVRLNWAPSNDLASSGFGADSPTVDAHGNLIQPYDLQDPAPAGTVGVFATAFSCDASLVDVAYSPLPGKESGCDGSSAANCSGCEKGCVGDPIRTSNGNVRYTETDPMPSNPAFRLVRFYDSESPSSGLFGTHWTSPFDARAYTINLGSGSLSDSHRAVFLSTERNQQVAFERRTSSQPYRQIWPRNQSAQGRLTFDGSSYIYQADGEGIVRTYDATTGSITGYRAVADDQGVTIAWQSGFPTTVTDNRGNWTLTVTNDGTVITGVGVTGQPSLQWSYLHTGSQLVNVEDAGSNVWRTYDYDSNSLLTQVSDARGAVIESHQYDAAGKGMTSSGPSGEVTNVVYNPSDRAPRTDDETITSVTYGSNYRADYYMRPIAGRLRVVTINGPCTSCDMNDVIDTYDDQGNVVREQDGRGYITAFNYDQSGSTLLSTSGPWRPASCDPSTDAQQCRLTPDDLATVPLATTTATKTTGYDYVNPSWPSRATHVASTSVLQPTASKVTSMTYDALSGEVLVRSVSGFTGQDAHPETRTTTVSLYDGVEAAAFSPGGNFDPAWETKPQPRVSRKSVDGPRTDLTDVTKYVYYPVDPTVPGILRGRLAAVRNAAGHTVRMENYDVFGNATRVVDANGVAGETTYDPLGRLLTSTLKGVSGCDTAADLLCATDLTSLNTYSPPTGPPATSVRPSGAVTVYGYDARGRLASLASGASMGTLAERIEYDYDPTNDLESQERYVDVASGNAVTRRESYGYDSSNRLSAVTHDDSTTIAYTYDGSGHQLTVKDERHSSPNTTNTYDAAGRLSKVTQALSTATGGTITTQYGYDINGNLTSVTDPNGNVTSYVYDDFGQLISQVSPVTGTTTSSYDLAGNTISTTDANQATTVRTYDALNRITSAVSSRTGLPTETVTYTYDVGSFGVGRLSTMDGTSYSYERRGLLTAVADDDGSTITFAYNANGDRTSLGYPSGRVAGYTFDFAGRPLSVSIDGTSVISAASYLPFGPMKVLTYGNSMSRTMSHDTRYRPMEDTLTSATGVITDYLYQEDPGRNITQIHDATNAAYNRDFGYDDLNRLTTANSGASLWGSGSYQYDAMGNMTLLHLGSRVLSFTYAGSTPLLQTVIGIANTAVQYDAAGNEVTSGTYSARNLMHPGGQDGSPDRGQTQHLELTYDGRGIRIISSLTSPGPPPWGGTTTRRSIYSPELNLLAQYDSSGMLLDGGGFNGTEYIWFGGQPVAQAFTDPAQPLRYTLTDHLGTPILQTNASATVVWRAEYEPYGSVYVYRAGDETDPQALRLPGQEADYPAIGQEYNIFRWYRSEWGRYTQADAVHTSQWPYAYADDDPLSFSDPLGRSSVNFGPVVRHAVDISDVHVQCASSVSGLKGCARLTHARFNCVCSECSGQFKRSISVSSDAIDVFAATNAPTDEVIQKGLVPTSAIMAEEMKHVADFQHFATSIKDSLDSLEEAPYSTRASCRRGCSAAQDWFIRLLKQHIAVVDASHPSAYYAP